MQTGRCLNTHCTTEIGNYMKELSICNQCQKEYYKKFMRQKYCCWECSRLAHIIHYPIEVECRRCGKPFMTHGRTKKYCSLNCVAKTPFIPKGTIKTGFMKKCLHCEKEFYTTPSMNNDYCSRKCVAQNRSKTFLKVICKVCGKEFETKRSYKAKTCSKECSYKVRAKKTTSLIVIPRNKLCKCSKCGYDKYPMLLERHHIDHDRSNNDLSNLLVLCPTCHDEVHYESKTGRFQFNSDKTIMRMQGSDNERYIYN